MHITATSSPIHNVQGMIAFIADSAVSVYERLGVAIRHTKLGEVSLWRDDDVWTLVVGLGEADKVSAETLRIAAGNAGRAANKEEWSSAGVILPGLLETAVEAQAVAQGLLLGTYVFDKYKAKKEERNLLEVVIGSFDGDVSAAVARGVMLSRGVMIARDLSNEPSNILRPGVLADFAVEHFANTSVNVTVFAEEELVARQMVGLLAVGKGSVHGPRFIQLRYVSDPTKPLIALVGKGITFDTGGINVKSGRDISDMRYDMSGAAAVLGAIDTLHALNVPCNVVGLIAAAENIPDGGSMLPGELITYPNGVSVQVGNTDAEGRLVLADALIFANALEASRIVDIATLTGAAAAALGPRYAAVFGTDDTVGAIQEAADATGDYVWRLPMADEYEEQLKSGYADICNISKGQAGAITAALFLRNFAGKDREWVHVDMAGQMDAEKTKGYKPQGSLGYGVRLLTQFVENLSLIATT